MAGDKESTSQPPQKIEANSPFYLVPQDRPGDFITPTRLRGDNYDDWARDIQTALEARRKFGFLDGTITKPEPPCTQSDWDTINAMLVSWIMNTIDAKVKCYLAKYRDARRLWNTLKSRYAVVNGPRIQQLKYAIAKYEQTSNMTVAEYFGKLTGLWEELHNHEPIISCSCCSECTAGAKHETKRDNDMLHKFLMGLNSDMFSTLCTSILSQDPLPTLDKAFQLVIQDERVRMARGVAEEKPTEAMGFSVRANPPKGRFREKVDKSHLICNHCRKNGHEMSGCFELVGYPEWWEDRSRKDDKSRGKVITRGKGTRVNAAITEQGSSAETSPLLFTAEQWKALTSLVGNTKSPEQRLNGEFLKRL